MKMIRVKARDGGFTDSANGIARAPGETFEMEETRARKKAREGFIDLLNKDGQAVGFDSEDVLVLDPQKNVPVATEKTPSKRKSRASGKKK